MGPWSLGTRGMRVMVGMMESAMVESVGEVPFSRGSVVLKTLGLNALMTGLSDLGEWRLESEVRTTFTVFCW